MGRHLYLHEVVDIVGQGQYDYMAHAGKEPTNVMPDMLTLQGTFFVCAMGGGRWPQVVNIWDVGDAGWEGWAANVDRLNLKRRHAFYGEWWDEAAQWRSGGFDRLCGAVPGSPSTPEIAEQGIRGTLFVHQVLQVRPGSPLDYLAEVVEHRSRSGSATTIGRPGSTRSSGTSTRSSWSGPPRSAARPASAPPGTRHGGSTMPPSPTTTWWPGSDEPPPT